MTTTTTLDELYPKLKEACKAAFLSQEDTSTLWAQPAYQVYYLEPGNGRRNLKDFMQRTANDGAPCQFTLRWMEQLAQGVKGCGGDLANAGDVSVSVVVLGRNHPDLLKILKDEPDIDMTRMQAHLDVLHEKERKAAEKAAKKAAKDDDSKTPGDPDIESEVESGVEPDVDEVEQKRRESDEDDRVKGQSERAAVKTKNLGKNLKPNQMLDRMNLELEAFTEVIAESTEFKPTDLMTTLDKARDLVAAIEQHLYKQAA